MAGKGAGVDQAARSNGQRFAALRKDSPLPTTEISTTKIPSGTSSWLVDGSRQCGGNSGPVSTAALHVLERSQRREDAVGERREVVVLQGAAEKRTKHKKTQNAGYYAAVDKQQPACSPLGAVARLNNDEPSMS